MTNKQIASYSIISCVVFFIAMLSGGEYTEGITMMIYYISLIGVYVFGIWCWVRLFRSNK